MLTLLALIGVTIYQTRLQERQDTSPVATKSDAEFVETLVGGPNDLQALEESQAEYQFQAVTDKAPLAAEEMPAYWRLMRWSMTQSFDELWERAHKDRYFTQFAEFPQKHRGELVALKLSVRRTVPFPALQNSAGAKAVYEAWGVTNESRANLYCVVFYDKPPELPIHYKIHEEVEFVGYFLKLMTYQDSMDKTRWTPVLIGRLRWRENAAQVALQNSQHGWTYWLCGLVAVIVAVVVWTNRYLERGRALLTPQPTEADHASIERWLENGATGDASPDDGPGPRRYDAWIDEMDSVAHSQSVTPPDADSRQSFGDAPK